MSLCILKCSGLIIWLLTHSPEITIIPGACPVHAGCPLTLSPPPVMGSLWVQIQPLPESTYSLWYHVGGVKNKMQLDRTNQNKVHLSRRCCCRLYWVYKIFMYDRIDVSFLLIDALILSLFSLLFLSKIDNLETFLLRDFLIPKLKV